ncbi:homeotic protein knotted-1-like [Iris pallida]|uniref:Homeotic protein knotted-1-like n=1 Tax=Iris pallida TaxID=29817 RepID=A0AAX6DV09_IRIPA|nr:homeotic protein knotted-1-like [Iris pallida]
MEEMYGFTPAEDLQDLIAAAGRSSTGGGISVSSAAGGSEDVSMKARIASHPRYPRLLQAYIDCQKVGAPPEIAAFLDEIRRDSDAGRRSGSSAGALAGSDPELDHFMETYCDVLVKYRSDLARPLEEASTFLRSMEDQLSHLCSTNPPSSRSTFHDMPRLPDENCRVFRRGRQRRRNRHQESHLKGETEISRTSFSASTGLSKQLEAGVLKEEEERKASKGGAADAT